jgi:hypothetical protein
MCVFVTENPSIMSAAAATRSCIDSASDASMSSRRRGVTGQGGVSTGQVDGYELERDSDFSRTNPTAEDLRPCVPPLLRV